MFYCTGSKSSSDSSDVCVLHTSYQADSSHDATDRPGNCRGRNVLFTCDRNKSLVFIPLNSPSQLHTRLQLHCNISFIFNHICGRIHRRASCFCLKREPLHHKEVTAICEASGAFKLKQSTPVLDAVLESPQHTSSEGWSTKLT